MGSQKRLPDLERLMRHVQKAERCWIWTGAKAAFGHGRTHVMKDGKWKGAQAHRAVYELLVGPIPEGLVLDHLCNNPSCVNPEHMKPCTQCENTQRAFKRRFTCKRGHPKIPENIYFRKSLTRGRVTPPEECRPCKQLLKRLSWDKHKERLNAERRRPGAARRNRRNQRSRSS
jgi:hypothetical protein